MLTSCPACQKVFDPMTGGYAPDATIVCSDCAQRLKSEAAVSEAKQQGSAFVGSLGALLIGLLSFFFEHRLIFFLFPVAAIGFGVGTAWSAFSSPEARKQLGVKRAPTIILGLTGAGLGVLNLAAQALLSPD